MALTEAMIGRRLVAFTDRWLATHLRVQCEAEERDVTKMVVPRASLRADAERRYAETDLPAVVLDVPQPGTAESGSAGSWNVWLPLRVVVVCGGDGPTARDDVGTYLGALRDLFLSQQTLDGLAAGVNYVGDGIDDAPVGQSRFMAFGTLDLSVLIRGIAERGRLADGAPPLPQPDPQPDPDVPIDGLDIDIDAREPTP
jgi:hypothetical protein